MRIVGVSGSGPIGPKIAAHLREHGCEAVAASLRSGVDTLTGVRRAEAMEGASVVVDVSNFPSWEAAAVLSFFEMSTRRDWRRLVVDANARSYGAKVGDRTLAPDDGARPGDTRFDNWLARAA